MPDIQRIPFHDDELYAMVDERTGKEYVLPKRFCEIFRLNWTGQHAKLTKNPLFSKRVQKISMQLPGDTQTRDVLLLERGMEVPPSPETPLTHDPGVPYQIKKRRLPR